jgi:hypothetical protein
VDLSEEPLPLYPLVVVVAVEEVVVVEVEAEAFHLLSHQEPQEESLVAIHLQNLLETAPWWTNS